MTTLKNPEVTAVIAAAGSGQRAGFGRNKLLAPLYGAPALWHTLKKFDMPEIKQVIVVCSQADMQQVAALAKPFGYEVVLGGMTRTDSVKRALACVTGDIVLIHDGARPFVSRRLIASAISAAKEWGSAVCALPCTDSLAKIEDGVITGPQNREKLVRLQTPQAFKTEEIRRAYRAAGDQTFTDDSAVYCKYIGKPHIVWGETENIKLTYAEDFKRELPPSAPLPAQRTGFGVDVHSFCEGEFLTLAGVKIDCGFGLLAHSDGDVAFHAITDALLSAAGLKDIGHYFPDTDPALEGADSAQMCKSALNEVLKAGYVPMNVSLSIQAEKPRLAPHIDKMIKKVASVLQIPESCVAVSAGTCEKLGFVGEGLGIAAYAYVLLKEGK